MGTYDEEVIAGTECGGYETDAEEAYILCEENVGTEMGGKTLLLGG